MGGWVGGRRRSTLPCPGSEPPPYWCRPQPPAAACMHAAGWLHPRAQPLHCTALCMHCDGLRACRACLDVPIRRPLRAGGVGARRVSNGEDFHRAVLQRAEGGWVHVEVCAAAVGGALQGGLAATGWLRAAAVLQPGLQACPCLPLTHWTASDSIPAGCPFLRQQHAPAPAVATAPHTSSTTALPLAAHRRHLKSQLHPHSGGLREPGGALASRQQGVLAGQRARREPSGGHNVAACGAASQGGSN